MNFEEDEVEDLNPGFTINYDMVISCKECLNVTRVLAADLKTNPYTTVGQWLKKISLPDLKILKNIIDENTELNHNTEITNPALADIVLIAEMLARAEGIISNNDDELMEKIDQFMMMITIESLYRRGLVKVYHENWSFGKDAGKRIIAEKIYKDNNDD
jgi:hypothetical protein